MEQGFGDGGGGGAYPTTKGKVGVGGAIVTKQGVVGGGGVIVGAVEAEGSVEFTGGAVVPGFSIGRGVAAIRSDDSQLWINYVINSYRDYIYRLGVGSTFPNISYKDIASLKIPYPIHKIQQAIISEVEAEQALINANRELIELFKNKIKTTINLVWDSD